MLRVSRVAGGQKNITIHISGVIDADLPPTPIDLEDVDKRAKLASLVWIVQEKLGLRLWWNEDSPLMPMESRNSVRFDNPPPPPKDWDGKVWLSSFNFDVPPVAKEKWFFLTLDFDK